MNELLQKIRELEWEELEFQNREVSIQNNDQNLLSVNNGIATLNLLDRKESENGEITFENSYLTLLKIEFSVDFSAQNVITKYLKLRHYAKLNEVFDFNNRNISCISITENTDKYLVDGNTVLINPDTNS